MANDFWTPDDGAPLGDLAYTDYGDLLDSLRKDLQLDASTDLLSQSVGPTALGAMPFWYWYWNDTSVGSISTVLPFVHHASQQGSIATVGGACKIGLPGIYHVSVSCRSDNTAAGAGANGYTELLLLLNGTPAVGDVMDNSNTNGLQVYRTHSFSADMVLNAGDLLTVSAFSSAMVSAFYGPSWPGSGMRVRYICPYNGE